MNRGTNVAAGRKVAWVARVLYWFAVVVVGVRRRPLPDLVTSLDASTTVRPVTWSPTHLARNVARVLRVGPWEPRCLLTSLVAYRMLQESGHDAELVIGLPGNPEGHRAHAWVEVDGLDVGPPPGRAGHAELARYGGRLG